MLRDSIFAKNMYLRLKVIPTMKFVKATYNHISDPVNTVKTP